jgi:PAS domain S-box-containing protein
MRLTGKVILTIALSVTAIISVIFGLLLFRFEHQMEAHLVANARAIYKSILTIRKWVSDYNGVYVKKRPGIVSNPFLPQPDRITIEGDTLTLRNPALVTRELSELSKLLGEDFSFHMASLKYINPINRPDDFERKALVFFQKSIEERKAREFYRIERINGHTYFRYFAPLYTEESCLACHAKQGYSPGDLRGGISILLRMDDYHRAKKSNLIFLGSSALISIFVLSMVILVALQTSIIRPLHRIEKAARRMEDGDYSFPLNITKKDEIGSLARAFDDMRHKIQEYTNRLASSEKKYRSLIENSLEAIAIIDGQGQILDCNQKLVHLTGYPYQELKKLNFYKLIDPANIRRLGTSKQKASGDEHFETILYTRDQFQIPVEIYITRGPVVDGRPDVAFAYVRDLTERKKIEQYSIQTEKMYALGQLSSGIAHEIRNPLFALNNNLDFLRQKFGHTPDFQEIYPELRDGIDRIQRIVSAILDYTRPHKPEFRPVHIDEVIQKSLTLTQKQFEKSAISVVTDLQHDERQIEADLHQLEQVFINLFLNAFQAMDGSGVLTIRTRSFSRHLEVQVIDTGKGIPEEDLPRIFDPFYTKSPNGTGLGLAIVQRILENHSAQYQVKSKVGLGTTFIIRFPYSRSRSNEV